jgi:hypothetical protein
MRPSKIVRAVNWQHAIGELVLIVVGILIALYISDWNDQRLQRIEENAMLNEIRSALETDLDALVSKHASITADVRKMQQLRALLENSSPYDPSMDELFGAVYGLQTINLNTSAYETLKSLGLQSISNAQLRQQIAFVFDHYYERIDGEHEIEQGINFGLMRPYYLQHFSGLQILQSATPVDYGFVASDPYYRNILDYRVEILEFNQLESYAEAAETIREVLILLDSAN